MTLLTTCFLLTFLLICFPQISRSNSSCEGNQLTVYKVTLSTYWSRELFPKHYPDWRPKAQFSKLVGRTHNADFKLFRMDEKSSEGVRIFAETGMSDNLNELSQGEGGMYDGFTAPPPPAVGRTETQFFVDGNHSKVSLMSRLIPSPDWFIGVDSLDLCNQGNWATSLTVQVDPLDAGSDDGLTFTAPNWPTNPRGVITKLTARVPNHPASSFFYPDKESLPSIASFQFIKVKEYELNQMFNSHQELELPESRIKSNDVIDSHSPSKMYPPITDLKMATLSASKSRHMSNNYIDYFTQLDSPQPEKKSKKQIKKDEKRKAKSKLQNGKNCPSNSAWCRRRHHRPLFNW